MSPRAQTKHLLAAPAFPDPTIPKLRVEQAAFPLPEKPRTPTASGTHLSLRHIEKRFGDRRVLDGLSLDVGPGEFVAIVGRSGCGKSTLLRLIAGLDPATGGVISLDTADGRRPSIRLMFQDARLLPWKSVLANVMLGLPSTARDEALGVLSEVGLADRARDWPSQLSGGQRQRVALARALLHKPDLLLLDEPLGALDALTRIEMHGLIERLWTQHGFTALLVTHDVQEAVALADRVLVVESGRAGIDQRVRLPRPRARGSAAFAALETQILDCVLSQQSGSERPATRREPDIDRRTVTWVL